MTARSGQRAFRAAPRHDVALLLTVGSPPVRGVWLTRISLPGLGPHGTEINSHLRAVGAETRPPAMRSPAPPGQPCLKMLYVPPRGHPSLTLKQPLSCADVRAIRSWPGRGIVLRPAAAWSNDQNLWMALGG